MKGFIARTHIPFGPLVVTFGYGPATGPIPVPPIPVEPEILPVPGPGRGSASAGRGPRLSRRLLLAPLPVTGTTSATKGRRGLVGVVPRPPRTLSSHVKKKRS